ncbi:UspA domain protein [Thermosulfidibacter takaii ABI70S6]|uniref:UspA domain protein n=1 Tax=Thermosulfidibacter takaii (strain DSM 17441 / JCM 13301 / NBRC 103674 / ABI70S6) TaxID=1298851 RepID=A0A0S3QVA2_THET7|nr:universal stress protein [Thermosulfidibacter takaii]BAT72265.1 UspA domain protein [Thermosulfidibacter takaii ABI70S6]
MIERILVATGGSPWSEKAVEYASKLAKKLGSKLVIVHVVEYPTVFSELVASVPFKEELRKQGEEVLKRAAGIAEREGVEYEFILKEGSVAENIAMAAVEGKADLVVVGSRARKGFFRESIGGIASKVAAITPCPVVIVKDTSYIEELLRKGILAK